MALIDRTYTQKSRTQSVTGVAIAMGEEIRSWEDEDQFKSIQWESPRIDDVSSAGSSFDLTSIFGDLQKTGDTAIGAVGSAVSDITAELTSQLDVTAFKGTIDSLAANVKTAIPDPMKAFGELSETTAKAFLIDPIKGGLDSLDFGQLGRLQADLVQKMDPGALSAIATRFSQEIPINNGQLKELANAARGMEKSFGLMGAFGSLVPTSIKDAVSSIEIPSGLKGFVDGAKSVLNGIEGALSVASQVYDQALPLVALATGETNSCIGSNVSYGTVRGMDQYAQKHFGINSIVPSGFSEYTNYSYNQNMFNTMMGTAVYNNMPCAVSALSGSSHMNSSTSSMLKKFLPGVASRGQSNMLGTLVDVIGPSGIGGGKDLISSLIQSPTLAAGAVGTVTNLMGQFGVKVTDLFGAGTTSSDEIIWDTPRINSSNEIIREELLPPDVRPVVGSQTIMNPETIIWNSDRVKMF